jgi:hypothetical protein
MSSVSVRMKKAPASKMRPEGCRGVWKEVKASEISRNGRQGHGLRIESARLAGLKGNRAGMASLT